MPIEYPTKTVHWLTSKKTQLTTHDKYPFPDITGLTKPKVDNNQKRTGHLSTTTAKTKENSKETAPTFSSSPLHGVTRLSVVVGQGDNAILSDPFNNGKGNKDKQGRYLDPGEQSVFCFAPGVDNPKICWKVRNTDKFTTVKLELFCKSDQTSSIWNITWNAKEFETLLQTPRLKAGTKTKKGKSIPIEWAGHLDWDQTVKITGDKRFPDGILTVEHSPYQLRMTVNDGEPGTSREGYPLVAWTYIHVCIGDIKLDWFPNPDAVLPANANNDKAVNASLKDNTDAKNLRGQLPQLNETKKVYLSSNIFYKSTPELIDNTFFKRYKAKWGNGPNIPILARLCIKKSDGTPATPQESAKAIGSVKLLWDFEDRGGDLTNISDQQIRDFLSNSQNYMHQADISYSPAGFNCHVDRGGKRGQNAQPIFPIQQAAQGNNVFPFDVTPCNNFGQRKWAAFSKTATAGNFMGQTGVIFQPSRMAGDSYQLHVYFAYDAEQNVLNTANLNDVPVTIRTSTGIFQVWREINIASSLFYGDNLSNQIVLQNVDGATIESYIKRRLPPINKNYDSNYTSPDKLKVEFPDYNHNFELRFSGGDSVLTASHLSILKNEYSQQILVHNPGLTSPVTLKVTTPPRNDLHKNRGDNVIKALEIIHKDYWSQATQLNNFQNRHNISRKFEDFFLRVVQNQVAVQISTPWLNSWYRELQNVCRIMNPTPQDLEIYVQKSVDFTDRSVLIKFKDYDTWRNEMLVHHGGDKTLLFSWSDSVPGRLDLEGKPIVKYWKNLAGATPLMSPWKLSITIGEKVGSVTQSKAGEVTVTLLDLPATNVDRRSTLKFKSQTFALTNDHETQLRNQYAKNIGSILSNISGDGNIRPYQVGVPDINIEVAGLYDSPNRRNRRDNVVEKIKEIHDQIWYDASKTVYEGDATGGAWAFVIAERVFEQLPQGAEGLYIFHTNKLHDKFSTLVGKSLLANAAGDKSGFWMLEKEGRQDTWEHEIGHTLFLNHTTARVEEDPRELHQVPQPDYPLAMYFTNPHGGYFDGRGLDCAYDGFEMLRVRGWSLYKIDQNGTMIPSANPRITTVTNPAHGTVQKNQANTKITYSPSNGFRGTDEFKYNVQDSNNVDVEIPVKVEVAPGATVSSTYNSVTTTPDTPVIINIIDQGKHPALTGGIRTLWKQASSNKAPNATPPPAWDAKWANSSDHPVV